MVITKASGATPPKWQCQSRVLRRLGFLLPVVVFIVLAVAFAIGLTLRPDEIPSALIGKPVPAFELPPVKGRTLGLSSTDLEGEVSPWSTCSLRGAWNAASSTRY